ncbi:MAG: hypothetical protein CMI00_01455 [Oceanospirillaceae bacterium]|jgi:hypothetical protein|nr:hypothetical protein [Oceanospirillaceae bacterium]|tara:strand:+ start:919 stop:1317 length:399 start_codon:yes stop_codon:yes gene_type:complete
MIKATSSVRLESSLINAATIAGIPLKRSAAEQIEYWAEIGRKVVKAVDPEVLLAVQSGLAVLRIEPTASSPIDPNEVFPADRPHNLRALREAIAAGSVRYQASISKPGYLEACYPDGHIEVGRFTNGRFLPE